MCVIACAQRHDGVCRQGLTQQLDCICIFHHLQT
jgi:hypothetical protein